MLLWDLYKDDENRARELLLAPKQAHSLAVTLGHSPSPWHAAWSGCG